MIVHTPLESAYRNISLFTLDDICISAPEITAPDEFLTVITIASVGGGGGACSVVTVVVLSLPYSALLPDPDLALTVTVYVVLADNPETFAEGYQFEFQEPLPTLYSYASIPNTSPQLILNPVCVIFEAVIVPTDPSTVVTLFPVLQPLHTPSAFFAQTSYV